MRKPSLGTILAGGGVGFGASEGGPATHGAAGPEPLTQPIGLASVYRFRDLDQVNDVWEGRLAGTPYRRFGHPNATALEELVACLEGAEEGLATSSGMGALFAALVAHVGSGEHVLAQAGLYGGTQSLLENELARLGLSSSLVTDPDPAGFALALDAARRAGKRVKAMLVETISNPALRVADLPGLFTFARENGLLLIVDNTFATPIACRPLKWGEALVVHSATKYLNGHSDVIAGVVAGPSALVGPARKAAIATGVTVSPLDAWLTMRGLKTLHLRFARQQDNAMRVARFLEGRPGVARVLYPGLESHATHAMARRVLDGFGAMVSFDLAGGEKAVGALVRRLKLIVFSPSLGETRTTLTYPALTSHRSLSLEEKEKAGAGPGLVRLSLGLEDPEDILDDLAGALP